MEVGKLKLYSRVVIKDFETISRPLSQDYYFRGLRYRSVYQIALVLVCPNTRPLNFDRHNLI